MLPQFAAQGAYLLLDLQAQMDQVPVGRGGAGGGHQGRSVIPGLVQGRQGLPRGVIHGAEQPPDTGNVSL